jgi:uroporphyrinogen-III synthase
LTGRTIVVTAPGRLAARLADLGAAVVDAPVIAIEGCAPAGVEVSAYDWVVFTSANAVLHFCPDVSVPGTGRSGQNIAAVGPATADALRARGATVDLVPDEAVAESLVAAFPDGPGRVLLPQAEGARPVLADGLRAKGWDVDVVVTYRTVAVALTDAQRNAARGADAIAFTSSSTVTNYLDAGGPIPALVVCIGPVTADTAAERGLAVAAVADPHTVDGLIAALVNAVSA